MSDSIHRNNTSIPPGGSSTAYVSQLNNNSTSGSHDREMENDRLVPDCATKWQISPDYAKALLQLFQGLNRGEIGVDEKNPLSRLFLVLLLSTLRSRFMEAIYTISA